MAPITFKTVYLFLAFVALPQVLAGPVYAHQNRGVSDCVKKCKSRWGSGGNNCTTGPTPPSTPTSTPIPATPTSSPSPAVDLAEVPSPSPSPDKTSTPPVEPSPAPNTTTTTTTNDFGDKALTGHNSFRALHGASSLTWNEELAAAASKWVSRCEFKHSGGAVGAFGENLAAGTGDYTVTDGIKGWTDESTSYDPANPTYSHFTQVVWKGTKELGCAVFTCPAGSIFDASFGSAQYIACEYNPPGNVIGQFAENVQA